MNYRIATNSDIDSLVNMRIAYLNDDYGVLDEITEEKIKKSLPDYFSKHLNHDWFAYLSEDDNMCIVATALLLVAEKPANPNFITGKTGAVLNVYTDKNYRRLGIAKHLMEMLLSDAEKMRLDFVELKATKDGYPLYKKIGFLEEKSNYTSMKYIFEDN